MNEVSERVGDGSGEEGRKWTWEEKENGKGGIIGREGELRVVWQRVKANTRS